MQSPDGDLSYMLKFHLQYIGGKVSALQGSGGVQR